LTAALGVAGKLWGDQHGWSKGGYLIEYLEDGKKEGKMAGLGFLSSDLI
jgi:hypothetical protein